MCLLWNIGLQICHCTELYLRCRPGILAPDKWTVWSFQPSNFLYQSVVYRKPIVLQHPGNTSRRTNCWELLRGVENLRMLRDSRVSIPKHARRSSAEIPSGRTWLSGTLNISFIELTFTNSVGTVVHGVCIICVFVRMVIEQKNIILGVLQLCLDPTELLNSIQRVLWAMGLSFLVCVATQHHCVNHEDRQRWGSLWNFQLQLVIELWKVPGKTTINLG